MARITLDSRTFQALASATRLGVLRALDERRKTLTELARGMELNKATVHEHLQLLSAAGLVRKRDDEGRKWIYYELTWAGETLLHPQESTTFNVLLGLSVAAAGGGFFVLGRALGWWLASRPAPALDAETSGMDAPTGADRPPAGAAASEPSPPPSGSGTQAPSPGPAGGAGGANEEPAMLQDAPKAGEGEAAAPPAADTGFWDDGGWLSVALLLAAAVFTLLAVLLRRHLRPGRFVPPAREPEAGEMPEPAPAPRKP